MVPTTFLLWNLNIILESLPVSSSGHLTLLQNLFSPKKEVLSTSTQHLMHIPNGIIIATYLAWQARCTLVTPSFEWLSMVLFTAIAANLITGVVYLLTKKYNPRFPLWLGFFISGSLLLSLSYVPNGTYTELGLFYGLLIGAAQTIALIPGISRMALTVCTAIWLGIDPNLSFIVSLVCELLLIIVAVGVALLDKNSVRPLWPIGSRQAIMLLVSSVISYKALEIAQYGFVTDLIIYFGWYLLALSIYSILHKPIIFEEKA